jgi:phospholipid/cholesterol/gamma-HCH transport system substrate-binding protein
MAKKSIDLWVGIFVAIGIGALFFLALKVGNLLNFREQKNGYELMANFENVGNLKPRAPVKSSGVVVGRVESIKLNPKTYEAEVRLHLENNFQFSRDTIAAIFTSGLLGEQFVGLDAGDPTSPMLKDEDFIKKTQSAIQIEKLISQFMFSKAQDAPAAPPASPSSVLKPSGVKP